MIFFILVSSRYPFVCDILLTIHFSVHRDESPDHYNNYVERSFVCRRPPRRVDYQHLTPRTTGTATRT